MQRALFVLALWLTGCWGSGERAPWNRPNSLLAHGQGPPAWLNDAIKDGNGDNMRMRGDTGKSGDPIVSKPRPPTPNADD